MYCLSVIGDLCHHSTLQPVHDPLQGRKSRTTVCVSSQVGCAMGCTFCYTGKCASSCPHALPLMLLTIRIAV